MEEKVAKNKVTKRKTEKREWNGEWGQGPLVKEGL